MFIGRVGSGECDDCVVTVAKTEMDGGLAGLCSVEVDHVEGTAHGTARGVGGEVGAVFIVDGLEVLPVLHTVVGH